MDSFLTLETPSPSPTPSHPINVPNFAFSHQIPNILPPNSSTTFISPPTTAISAGQPLQTLLVPKPEPFDDFFATQDTQQQPFYSPGSGQNEQSDLYNEFYRVSQLFNSTFDSVDSQSYEIENNNDRSLVVVPERQESSSQVAVAVVKKRANQVMELVRVSDLSVKDQINLRELMRKTRMVYDSLRVLASIEEEKRMAEERRNAAEVAVVEEERRLIEERRLAEERRLVAEVALMEAEMGGGEERNVGVAAAGVEVETPRRRGRVRNRIRGDMRAAALMRKRELWLYRDKRIVGPIPGVYVGDVFLFRMELCVVGLHMQIQAGIDYLPKSRCSNGEPIATSVIVSGGYEDDMELNDGDVIIYTGHGGQEKNSSRQICDQKLVGGNLALERSMHYGIEVRVIRGMKYEGSASGSGKVYVYDGLYRIVDCWFDVGKSGFGVYKYKLMRIEGQAKLGSAVLKEARDIKKSGLDFKPMYCLSVDISNNRESVPVRLFNDIDDNQEPLFYEYLRNTTFPQFVFHQSGKATGCQCVEACTDGCFCSMKNGGEFPYNLQGLLVRGKPLIFECGPFCSCPPNCRNRVAQKGLKFRLEVFRSTQTGWGVRSLDLIQAGAFICEYTGVVLTREQAQILTMNGDSLIYPNRFSDRWAEWGDLSQIYTDYERPSYPSVPPLDFSLDVSTMRNVACYMSHSTSPNVFVQYVLYDHNNLMFPHVMLYATENIPPMRELSVDYGLADEWTGKLSICM
ncbi:histone-lysine N-methyltransferase family member SUVH9-like isoform X2 [Trifolium pratense]|uniref:histone-lysine N-methyltransferase family member SUVH9-like isoform X2 n=1 Tax=Trifolium pratense TaxID=57577 RepID=UPI001E693CAA|nr:histone-lysine N-methyltransferase family member SUVH9-like isoform X2 [Trifolium pratense]